MSARPPSCFSALTRTQTQASAQVAVGPDHWTVTAWRLDNWLCIIRSKTSSAEYQWTRPLPGDLSMSKAPNHAFGAALRLTARVVIASVRVCVYCVAAKAGTL